MQHLDWDGCWNARDLGGLGRVRPGAVVRSDHLDALTPNGWNALRAYGVRTLVDLRSSHERAPCPPDDIGVVHTALEEGLDLAAWGEAGWLSTPLYYSEFLRRWPERCAAAVEAVALARPGGVVVHCGKGCDRTGLIVSLLLATCGVSAELIVDDYLLTAERLRSPRALALGRVDDADAIARVLQRADCPSLRDALLAQLKDDVVARLGLAVSTVTALRARMLSA